jgi:opacity protein-like surface antigen
MTFCATSVRRLSVVFLFATLIALGSAQPAHAQGFVSPFIGYNFGGDSSCPGGAIGCEDKHVNYGVSFGALVKFIGFEVEIAYTPDFFGANVGTDTNVLTSMGNLMLAPRFGPIQPYGVIGAGIIRTSVSNSGVSSSQNQVGFDGGGGLMVFFNKHVGVRGEVRYYHSFQALERLNLPSGVPVGLGGEKLDFGRAAGAFVFEF